VTSRERSSTESVASQGRDDGIGDAHILRRIADEHYFFPYENQWDYNPAYGISGAN